MKKWISLVLTFACALGLAGCAGGEIGFQAHIDSVAEGMAYATVTKDDAGFGSKKLPERIVFSTADLGEELQSGDRINGCYLSGTIDGQSVRVVSVAVIERVE